MPPGFGPHGGEIWMADEEAMLSTQSGDPAPLHRYSQFPLSPTAEGVYVIPNPPCTFCGSLSFGLAEQQQIQFVWLYPHERLP